MTKRDKYFIWKMILFSLICIEGIVSCFIVFYSDFKTGTYVMFISVVAIFITGIPLIFSDYYE